MCPACGTGNDFDARFCEQCGTSLAAACPSCGAPVTPGKLFCKSCGSALSSPEPARTQAPDRPVELRVVSVLFVDLVGYTTLAESRDAEDARELLSRYFDTARKIMGRYGASWRSSSATP